MGSMIILMPRHSTAALFRRQPADHPWYTGSVQLPHTALARNPIFTHHSGDSFES